MRATWSGFLYFGLIQMPVKLYAASESVPLDLDLLHKTDLEPIHNVRVCSADGQEVTTSDIVRGFKYKKGDYVVLTEDDFRLTPATSADLLSLLQQSLARERKQMATHY